MDSSSHSSQQGEPSSIYFTPHEATGLPSPESLGVRNATAAKTGASVPPSIRDLFDPSKFDVEVEGAEARRFFRFTPRPDPTAAGPNGSPLWYGEAGLRLMGVSKNQINDLVSRAATKHPEGGPKKSSEQGKKKPPMSEHTLPDDFSRWPVNPFALLGVRPGVNERDLRRAYTRLIRIYKPEHFPEQFRRIREAYEAARDRLPFTPAFKAPADPPAQQQAPATPEADKPSTPAAQRPAPNRRVR